MKVMLLHLYLLMWFQGAEALTDQLINLGQSVSINCDFDVKEVNWLLLKLPDPPVLILTSSTIVATFYYNKTFKQKYSVQSKHCLIIQHVTIDELGLYYCVTKEAHAKYSNGTKLHTEDGTNLHTTAPGIQNPTEVKTSPRPWQIFSLTSGLLNAILIAVIIGLASKRKRTTDNLNQSQDAHLQQPQADLQEPQNLSQVQYVTAQFSQPSRRFQPSQFNSTYALLQLPNQRT